MLTMAVYAARDPGRRCDGYDVPLSYGFATMVCHFVGVSGCVILFWWGVSGCVILRGVSGCVIFWG